MPTGVYTRTKPVWNKGKHIYTGGGFQKGHIPWNKGDKGLKNWMNISGLSGKGDAPWNKGIKYLQITGEKNYQWKGEQVGYRTLHRWIIKNLGSAKQCEYCGKVKTTPKSIHWANIDHKYKRNLTDWIALCASCHKKYDIAMKKSLIERII